MAVNAQWLLILTVWLFLFALLIQFTFPKQAILLAREADLYLFDFNRFEIFPLI